MHTADPVWPILVLAAISAVDAVMCWQPLPFIAQCLRDVNFPERFWKLLTPIKAASAIGLVAGLWWAWLGALTGICLVIYFAIAVAMHVRAGDTGHNLVNAAWLGILTGLATWWCFFV